MTAHRITALDVRCVACGANAGERCHVTTDVLKKIPPHGRRREEAARQDRIANPEHVDGQLSLFPRTQAGPAVFLRRRGRR